MSRADGRVRPGQNLATAFSARAWNRAQDAADAVLGDRGGLAAASEGIDRVPNFIMISNQSGHSVPRLGVLGIDGVLINPSGGTLTGTAPADARAKEFARRPVLSGITPNISHRERFAVLLEPAAPNAVVRAVVSGVFACLVQVVNTNHAFATAKSGDREQLISSECGVLQLLWVDAVVGQKRWAVGVM